jgi:preprotein translocase subunit SecE
MTYHGVPPKRSRFKFVGDIIAELKKVTWLTRREAAYLTFLVLVISIVVGIILGTADLGFYEVVQSFFLGR